MEKSGPVNTINMLERVAKLEERVNGGFVYVEKELKEIKENHLQLQHLQTDVNELKIQVNTLAVKISIAVAIATITVDIAFRFFFK